MSLSVFYAPRLRQIEEVGDENTLAAVEIARDLLAQIERLERRLASATSGTSGTPTLDDHAG